ncbi:hypothetical protein MY04_05960 (plasmid) [Flammeovirga sp. MY04]|uniref:hypothetical protein n=1 Tax=Flammeovirga sp. MY04 TaxID=1191459 RepID=UPI000806208F|nr:hypothetical protein [Flammeovirga sp. MY04]ANQ52925.1 hypothetical protein MY04_05960 [Flammeovirga sp. MY04]
MIENEIKNSQKKTCIKCGETKPKEEFNRNNSKDGRRSDCKVCSRKANKLYREANKEKLAQYNREYRVNNLEAAAERQRRYYQMHKDDPVFKEKQRLKRLKLKRNKS